MITDFILLFIRKKIFQFLSRTKVWIDDWFLFLFQLKSTLRIYSWQQFFLRGRGRSLKYELIGLFVSQDPSSHWVMQTNHSVWFVAVGGTMGGAKATYFPKFRVRILFCWSNFTTMPRIKSGDMKTESKRELTKQTKTNSQSINQLLWRTVKRSEHCGLWLIDWLAVRSSPFC